MRFTANFSEREVVSVKIPPMSPTATFNVPNVEVRAILVEFLKQKLSAIYGDVEVRLKLRATYTGPTDGDWDNSVTAEVEFIVKPKVMRD